MGKGLNDDGEASEMNIIMTWRKSETSLGEDGIARVDFFTIFIILAGSVIFKYFFVEWDQ